MPFHCASVRDFFHYHYRNGPGVHSDPCPLRVCNGGKVQDLTYGIECNTEFNIAVSWHWYAFNEVLYKKNCDAITVTSPSKARTVFARSNAGIVGSNPTQGMDICVHLICVCVILCVGSGLETR
jgi:hypothetical protein